MPQPTDKALAFLERWGTLDVGQLRHRFKCATDTSGEMSCGECGSDGSEELTLLMLRALSKCFKPYCVTMEYWGEGMVAVMWNRKHVLSSPEISYPTEFESALAAVEAAAEME